MPSDRRRRPSSNGPTRLERPPTKNELTTPDEALFGAEPMAAIAQDAEPTRTVDGARTPAVPNGFPIEGWDRYEIISVLGKGGMGVVYKARDPQLSRFVALKFLVRTEPERARRFIAEARAQAKVEHEHICKVYEVGTANGIPYIAMQLIDGQSLGALGEQLSLEDKVHVMRKIAGAVHAAHQAGLIHRDLKRSNIMVERTESGKWQPFVLDFGIAREVDAGATVAGEVAGTPAYMAPEQARGERADRRTDVWGLGATLYAVLAGRPPNQGTTAEAFAALVTAEVPPIRTVAPRLPSDLATIVMKCLEPKPERRYASAADLAEDLRRYLAGEPISARPRSLVYRASKGLRRSWELALALAVACAAVVAVVALLVTAAAQRRMTDKRVRIAQHFGQEVARLETFMRQAYAAPLHDLRRERQHVLDRMAALEAEARELGDIATGPAEYAVGRGQLSLHDYASARPHLEAALHAGYDAPEVRYALGLSLAALYRQGLAESRRIRDKAAREARQQELRTTLRDPALGYLRAVRDFAPEAPAYAEGLVALYESDYATALAKAAAAAQTAPWLYEAHQLAGDALAARSSDASDRGAYADAATDLVAAGKAYAAALAQAPSDTMLLDADCRLGGNRVSLAIETRQLEHADVDAAVAPCESARQTDPDSAPEMVREAYILADAADYFATRKGERPDAMIARAMPLVDAALARDPKSVRAFHARSMLYGALANAQADHRENAEPTVDLAIEALHHVIELDPGYADAYADLAFLLSDRAEREREAGHDPRAILTDAVAIAERGIAVAPKSSGLQGDLGAVWHARADYEAEHGLDPQESLGHAIAAFEASLAQNPKNASSLNNMGLALHTRAYYRLEHGQTEGEADLDRAAQSYERVLALGADSKTLNNLGYLQIDRATYLERTGRDPRPAVEVGVAYLRRALAVNPAERFVHFNAAGLKLIEAEYLVENGEDPAPALATVESEIDADLRRSDQPDPDILAYRSDAYVLAARAAIAHAHSPAAAFAAADAALGRAEKLDATTGYVVDARVNLERWRAEWLVGEGRDATATLAHARQATAQVAELTHDNAAAHLLAGEVAVVEARSLRGTTDERRAAAVAAARRELAAAVAGNRFYERQVTPLVAELDAMK